MSSRSIVTVWIAAVAVIAIVFGSLTYSASANLGEATSTQIKHDLIPPFRG